MRTIIILFSILSIIFLWRASPLFAVSAELSLEPASGTIEANKPFFIQVMLDPAGNDVVGFDAILQYDARKMDVLGVKDTSPEIDVAYKKIDPDANTITITGLVPLQKNAMTKKTAVARLEVKARDDGSGSILFDQQKSRIADGIKLVNVLGSIRNGEYQVQARSVFENVLGTQHDVTGQSTPAAKPTKSGLPYLPIIATTSAGLAIIGFFIYQWRY